LMAAEIIANAGLRVDLYDAMPSVGRKFLLAGKGGMNLTHSEPAAPFLARYGVSADQIARWLDGFGPQTLRDWVHGLGVETFVGSSGRVFPTDMKAARRRGAISYATSLVGLARRRAALCRASGRN